MCQSHKRTYGIELEGYTSVDIKGDFFGDWEFVEDGSLEEGNQECGYCEGRGERYVECPSCDGEGDYGCGDCFGDGSVECCDCNGSGQYENEEGEMEECPFCDGRGSQECKECEGRGRIDCEECDSDNEVLVDCDECDGNGEYGDGEESVECVSPILEEGDYSEIDRVFDYIDRYNWNTKDDCGTHVHVGGKDLSAQELSRLAILVNILEPVIYGCLPYDRYSGRYSKPINKIFVENLIDEGEEISLYKLCSYYYNRDRSPDSNFSKYEEARYYGLNLHSWFYRKTVEFRYFNGSDYSDEAKRWIELSIKLVDFAKYSTFESLIAIGRDFYAVNNLEENLERMKTMLDLSYDWIARANYAYNDARQNVANQIKNGGHTQISLAI